jgi:hypothetical protein
MRKNIRIAVMPFLLAILCVVAAGCGNTSNAQQNQNSNVPQGMSGTMGVITEVSANSITIAVMPQGQNGGFGDDSQRPSGSGRPNASGAPQDSQASGQPDGTPGAMPTFDTSSWEKKTFTIDSQTKITQGQTRGSSNSESKTLAASDLKAGDSVSIEARSGQDTVAGAITVTAGMWGGEPGQGGPQGSAPAPSETAKS